jgi:hypothetical protein
MNKPPKRLFKTQDVIHSYQHDRSTKSRMKHLERDHLDVLQNIEFALVQLARQDPVFDDRMIDHALSSYIRGTEPPGDADHRVPLLVKILEVMRGRRRDVSDDVWIAALRKVDESVQLHSELRPGEKSYLQFVDQYLP